MDESYDVCKHVCMIFHDSSKGACVYACVYAHGYTC